MDRLLDNKTAIVYGGGGHIGSGVARTFAAEGATVFLVGRTLQTLERVAAEIGSSGGRAHVAALDCLDEDAVEGHAKAVVNQSGGIDAAINLTSRGDVQGTRLLDMPADDFLRPTVTGLRANFVTARVVARHMVARGSG